MTLYCVRFEPGVLTFQSQGRERLQCQRVARPDPAAQNVIIHVKVNPDDVTKLCVLDESLQPSNLKSLIPADAGGLSSDSDSRLVESCSSSSTSG